MKCFGSRPETSLFTADTAENNVYLVQCSKWHRETEQKNSQRISGSFKQTPGRKLTERRVPVQRWWILWNISEINVCSTINTEQSKSAPQVVPDEAGTSWNLLILKCMCAYLPYTQLYRIIYYKFTKNVLIYWPLFYFKPVWFEIKWFSFFHSWNIKKGTFRIIFKLLLDIQYHCSKSG